MNDVTNNNPVLDDDVPPCPGHHCSGLSDRINRTCRRQGHSGDRVYVLLADGSECFCNCSCSALNTPIAINSEQWMRIQDIAVGDTVLTATPSGQWQAKEVKFSDGTQGDGMQVPGTIYIKTENDIELIVTADHPFLLANGSLQQAKRLKKTDKLMSDDFTPVGIKVLTAGHYAGGIWNISTTTSNEPGEPLDDHLINTAGIITGDFYAQLFLVEDALLSEPAIGSTSYAENHAIDDVDFDARVTNSGINKSKFVPYKKFQVPAGAVSFLPEYSSEAKPGLLRPLDDSLSLEYAEYIAWLFKRIYSDVIYHVRDYWSDDTVNAYAWKEGDEQHIALLGGLIRHQYIKKEGLALVTAHEIGHHYGGEPYYPGTEMSCEGQADYWAAWIAMRDVFPGDEYFDWTQPGIDQLYNLFSSGLLNSVPDKLQRSIFERSLGCGHPPADCRKETYLAAMRLDAKPDCADLIRKMGLTNPCSQSSYNIVNNEGKGDS